MAKWTVYENSRGNLNLTYRNSRTGQIHQCGEMRRDTPANMIVDWVVMEGDPNPGDLIRLHDGTFLAVSLQQGIA